jgi:hypothetical protein
MQGQLASWKVPIMTGDSIDATKCSTLNLKFPDHKVQIAQVMGVTKIEDIV